MHAACALDEWGVGLGIVSAMLAVALCYVPCGVIWLFAVVHVNWGVCVCALLAGAACADYRRAEAQHSSAHR
jgi:fructose-specific phosphotransferase system IIC component